MNEKQNLDIEFWDFSSWRELTLLGSSLSQPLILSRDLNPCGDLFPQLIHSPELWHPPSCLVSFVVTLATYLEITQWALW